MNIIHMYLLANSLCTLTSGILMVPNAGSSLLSRSRNRQRIRFHSPSVSTSMGALSLRRHGNRFPLILTYFRTSNRRHRNILNRLRVRQFHRFNVVRQLNSPYNTTTQLYATTTQPTAARRHDLPSTTYVTPINPVTALDGRSTSFGRRNVNNSRSTSLSSGLPNNNIRDNSNTTVITTPEIDMNISTTPNQMENDIRKIQSIADPLKRQQTLKEFVKQLINASGIIVNDFSTVHEVSKLEDLIDNVINVTKRLSKSTNTISKLDNVTDTLNKTGTKTSNTASSSLANLNRQNDTMPPNQSSQVKHIDFFKSISTFARNINAGRRKNISPIDHTSSKFVSNINASSLTKSNGPQLTLTSGVLGTDNWASNDTIVVSTSVAAEPSGKSDSGTLQLVDNINGMSIYGASKWHPTAKSVTDPGNRAMLKNGMSIYGEGKPQSTTLTTEMHPRASHTSDEAAMVAAWAGVSLNGVSIYGGRQPQPPPNTQSPSTTIPTVGSPAENFGTDSWQGGVVKGMSIFGSEKIQPTSVSTIIPPTTASSNPALEPLGGSLGYWSHLLAGLIDMLCQLCRQRNIADCIQRHCMNTHST